MQGMITGGEIMDPCMLGQDRANALAGMFVARAQIQPISTGFGTVQFGQPQLIRVTCPNLTLQLSLPFSFMGFVNVDGTMQIAARATVMSGANGAMTVCLSGFRLQSISIPAAPSLEPLAMSLIGENLTGETCFSV